MRASPIAAWLLFSMVMPAATGPAKTARMSLDAARPTVEPPIPLRAAAFVSARPFNLRVRASANGALWTEWMDAPCEEAEAGRWSGLVYFGGPYRYLEIAGDRDGVELIAIDAGSSAEPKPRGRRQAGSGPAVVSREQ